MFYDSDFDIEETADKYIVKLEVGGVNKDKLNVEINRVSITVSGEHSAIEKEQNPHGFYSSHSVGSFLRTIPLPDYADTERVNTEVNDDMVIITLPKK